MNTQQIGFPNEEVPCAFPEDRESLAQAISTLNLEESYPVIVLIGGDIQEPQAQATHKALETLAKIAEDAQALVICAGKDTGLMAEIGLVRYTGAYTFPLVGIALKALVTWPDGPESTNFLWWGKKRLPLAPHFSHFILVPGSTPAEESAWIFETASLLSKNHRSVTILMSGDSNSREDIQRSIEQGRPVIAVGGTGRLPNELASQPTRDALLSVVPARAEERLNEAFRAALGGARVLSHIETAPAEIELNRDESELVPSGHAPTILSQRDEFKPIHSEKSQAPIPDSFTK